MKKRKFRHKRYETFGLPNANTKRFSSKKTKYNREDKCITSDDDDIKIENIALEENTNLDEDNDRSDEKDDSWDEREYSSDEKEEDKGDEKEDDKGDEKEDEKEDDKNASILENKEEKKCIRICKICGLSKKSSLKFWFESFVGDIYCIACAKRKYGYKMNTKTGRQLWDKYLNREIY